MITKTGDIDLDSVSNTTSALLCPRCGSMYLHHQGATFYDRREDALNETVIAVQGQGASVSLRPHDGENPSSRRHGMVIQFRCEECSKDGDLPIEMTIAQHKGITEIGWRFHPRS